MANNSKLHVVMLPWLAFGHIIPFLELSKFMAQRGHRITFISTPRNIERLPEIPPNLSASITLVKVPLPKVDGLPSNAEATMDIRTDQMSLLKKAYDCLEPDLTRFLENSVPDWIIHDFCSHWLQPVAAKLGISKSYFCIVSPWTLGFFGPPEMLINGTDPRNEAEDFLVPPKWVTFPTKVAYRIHEINWILGAVNPNISGASDAYRLGMVTKGSDVVTLRYCNEFEGDWLKLLNEIYPSEVMPLGLMPPPQVNNNSSDEKNEEMPSSIKEWLNNQNKASVVYVALGSEVSPTQTEISELALGLELSRVPFFWVLRKTPGFNESESVELPDKFEERVEGRGIVWKSWAPQLKILNHESVGGFLTHCGWGSTIEGLAFGHPLIMLPFLVDQGLNARVLEDKQVGIEVPRNEQDGSYTRNSVAQTVRLIMIEDEGKRFRDGAKEMSGLFGNTELHDAYMHRFLEFLEDNQHKSKN
ncbi:hypothetical protein ACH5RR_013312 [Cinchona calisaya]|uniref:Glycosyltransferase n=1 Tax=Cinchona calisaya TaxID=153742 RepID=A0ABD3A327_9GENT